MRLQEFEEIIAFDNKQTTGLRRADGGVVGMRRKEPNLVKVVAGLICL